MNDEKKRETLRKAYNTLILSLSDKVLREIVQCKSAANVWLKLESLDMTKNLSSRLHIKVKFFTWKMKEGRNLQGHIDDFNRLTVDLDNIRVEYENEDNKLTRELLSYKFSMASGSTLLKIIYKLHKLVVIEL